MNSVEIFFEREFENKINEAMFFRNYVFPKEEVISYIKEVCNISFTELFEYIYSLREMKKILPTNIYQFSSLEDCTTQLCAKLLSTSDEGLRFNEVGELFETYKRNDMANRKYGENAAKTGRELGLCQIIDNYVFLSCIGKVLPELSKIEIDKLISRLIVRSNYFVDLFYLSKEEKLESCILMSALSDKTKLRRKSNIKKLLVELKKVNDPYLNEKLNNIIF